MPPEPHRLILPATSHQLPVWAPVDGVHLVLVPREIRRQLEIRHGPHLERRVLGRRDQQPRVRREGALVDRRDVAP